MRHVALLAVLAVGFFGCRSGSSGDTEAAGGGGLPLDEHRTLGEPVVAGNVTLWPVFTDAPVDAGEFLTLEEALAQGVAEVREVGADRQTAPPAADSSVQQLVVQGDGATVGTLVVENRGELPILLCAGTVVTGGKQDRQIGQDVVLKAHSTTPVDAFCVEQGRWSMDRLGHATDGKFQVAGLAAIAPVRAKAQYEKDQGGVWQEVAEAKEATLQITETETVLASTTSFAVVADAAKDAEDAARVEDALREHLASNPEAVGFAYALNGKVVGVRAFAHPRVFGKHRDLLVRTIATEALLAEGGGEPARAADVLALVRGAEGAAEEVVATDGLNKNVIRKGEVAYMARCVVGGNVALVEDWTAR